MKSLRDRADAPLWKHAAEVVRDSVGVAPYMAKKAATVFGYLCWMFVLPFGGVFVVAWIRRKMAQDECRRLSAFTALAIIAILSGCAVDRRPIIYSDADTKDDAEAALLLAQFHSPGCSVALPHAHDAPEVARVAAGIALRFDADGGSTGDDRVTVTWTAPDDYEQAHLLASWVAMQASAGDDVAFLWDVRGIGETFDGMPREGSGHLMAEAKGSYHMHRERLPLAAVQPGDLVKITFSVDESHSEVSTVDVIGLEVVEGSE